MNSSKKLIKVLWLRPHTYEEDGLPGFSYSKGNIGFVTPEHAEKLTADRDNPYVKILPEGWVEPVASKEPEVPESELINVRWVHAKTWDDDGIPAFAYRPGDVCKLKPLHAEQLIQGGYVDLVEETQTGRKNILKKLGLI